MEKLPCPVTAVGAQDHSQLGRRSIGRHLAYIFELVRNVMSVPAEVAARRGPHGDSSRAKSIGC